MWGVKWLWPLHYCELLHHGGNVVRPGLKDTLTFPNASLHSRVVLPPQLFSCWGGLRCRAADCSGFSSHVVTHSPSWMHCRASTAGKQWPNFYFFSGSATGLFSCVQWRLINLCVLTCWRWAPQRLLWAKLSLRRCVPESIAMWKQIQYCCQSPGVCIFAADVPPLQLFQLWTECLPSRVKLYSKHGTLHQKFCSVVFQNKLVKFIIPQWDKGLAWTLMP